MAYVDGFVLTVLKENLAAYRKDATLGKKIWMKHGALDYKECMLDDAHPKDVNFTFPKMAKAKPGEVVFFSYIVYKNRKHRDQVNKKVMADPAMNDPKQTNRQMPFDMKRFAYGGFTVEVSS